MIVTDLEKVDPTGRIDVLAYKGLEKIARILEEKYQVKLWDVIRSDVNKMVVNGVGGLEIPSEARLLLGILQANMGKEV